MPSTDLATIFQTIVAQFAAIGGDANQYSVFTSLTPDVLEPEMADLYIAIKPGEINVDQRTLAGGSNIDLYMEASFEAWIWIRLDLDAGIRADSYLEDPTYGLFPVIYSMISAGNMYQINAGAPAPMRLVTIGPFERRHGPPGVPLWGVCRTTWHYEFQQSVAAGSIPYPV
jgi:hypothetical protein